MSPHIIGLNSRRAQVLNQIVHKHGMVSSGRRFTLQGGWNASLASLRRFFVIKKGKKILVIDNNENMG